METKTVMDQRFEDLGNRYLDKLPALSPVFATSLGDHRFDSKLDEVSIAARKKKEVFYTFMLESLKMIPRDQLSRPNQIDYTLLEHELNSNLWSLKKLREWEWNPLSYTGLAGGSIYGLMARDFAPLKVRLNHVADRLEQFPRLFKQVRLTLVPERVPKIHAETAVKQNRGVLSIIKNMIRPRMDELNQADRTRLEKAIRIATDAVEAHQKWLENELLPKAGGDFRLGRKLYDEKLHWVLNSSLTRKDVRERAEKELHRVRNEMYEIAKGVYLKENPGTEFPENPTRSDKQKIIEAALDVACKDRPARDQVVMTAKRALKDAIKFVREKDLVTVPPDPVEVIIMPEFQRGVSLAYCSAPGALEVGQKTFYAVAPLPSDWTDEQVTSFLREYNRRSIYDLTVHEAMPGHFLQLAHSNRYPGKLRALLGSGVFIEGWAVYAETMMCNQGFPDTNPLSKLVVRKWYLRGIANSILDQAIHTEGMKRDEAMKLMTEDTFQEEREAAAKWVRAQLTSAQLSTYFVGSQEHWDMRREMEKVWGDKFSLKKYHDKILSYGSPPVRFVRAMVLDEPIPE